MLECPPDVAASKPAATASRACGLPGLPVWTAYFHRIPHLEQQELSSSDDGSGDEDHDADDHAERHGNETVVVGCPEHR